MQAVHWQAPVHDKATADDLHQLFKFSLLLLSFQSFPTGLGISDRLVTALCHIAVSLTSPMQDSKALQVKKIANVVSYLKHSRIRLALEPKRSGSLSRTHGRHDWRDTFLSERLDEI